MEENVSNNKFLIFAIVLITLVGLSGFLIGYGINQGDCPVCSDKKVVKVFTTTNNIEDTVDYNMVTSAIKTDLIGKYVNKNDSKIYLEILKDGTFTLSTYDDVKAEYKEYTNEEYVLLIYYSKEEVKEEPVLEENTKTPVINETEEVTALKKEVVYEYETTIYFIPKGQIEGDLITNMITFKDPESTSDGISKLFVGPKYKGTEYYIKK